MLRLRLGLDLIGEDDGALNVAPTNITWSGSHSVAEDAAFGTQIGSGLSATDEDAGAIVFSLTDDAGGLFALAGNQVIVVGVLNFEEATSHQIIVRATDVEGLNFEQAFTVTVTDVSEDAPPNPPPDGDIIVDDPDTYDVQPYEVVVDEGVKIAGKKKAGAAGKIIRDVGAPFAGHTYKLRYSSDWSLLANLGRDAMVGFGFKNGNSFYLVGLKGDGSSGLVVRTVSGASPNGWTQTTGHTEAGSTPPAQGSQAGPNWIEAIIAENGSTVTFKTGTSETSWTTELSDQTPTPLSNATDAITFGPCVWLPAADNGPFVIDVLHWIDVAPLQISGTPVTTGIEYEHGVGSVYAGFTVSAAGGKTPYTYSVASGTLPSGITLNSSSGAVSGTPALESGGEVSTAYNDIVIRATDAEGRTADLASFGITISYKDPYFNTNVLLAGFNGVDGATTYTEEKNGRTVSFSGNAQLDDAQKAFGTASLRVDGTGDVATLADNADWQFASTETMEYTLEMRVRFNSISNANHMLFGQSNSVGTLATQCFIPSGNLANLTYNHFHNGSAGGGVTTTSGGLTTGQWFWIAVTKNASKKLRVRINGVMRGTFTLTTGTMFDSTQTMALGSNSGNSIGMDGWIDEVRFNKGKDRFDTDADVPVSTRPHPRS